MKIYKKLRFGIKFPKASVTGGAIFSCRWQRTTWKFTVRGDNAIHRRYTHVR